MNVIAELVDMVIAAGAPGSPFAVCSVTNVEPGAAKDGNPLVTVDYYGTPVYATYGAHYTPAIGHVVFVANAQPRVILCRLIGTPPTP